MTRCGDRRCTVPSHNLGVGAGRASASRSVADRVQTAPTPKYQAHPIPPLPSNVQLPPSDPRLIGWMGGPNLDPGYDQPGPPRRSDLSWAMVVQAFVVFVAIVMFCVLASLVEVGRV